MLNLKQLNVTAREIADYCEMDVRTINRHVVTILESLGHPVNTEKTANTEIYGEFKIQRLWSPSGRLNHLLMNRPMAEMLLTRLDVKTAYKLCTLLQSYRRVGGVLLDEVCKQHGIPVVAEVLTELGIISKKLEAEPNETYKVALNKMKNSGGEVQAIFLHIPEVNIEDGELVRMRKSLYLYGETAYQVLELLSQREDTHIGEITLN